LIYLPSKSFTWLRERALTLFIGAIITYYVLNRPSQQDRENEEYLKELKRKL
jgi:hypothetical protein